MKHRAFTLVEILIVIMITGIVSVGLAISFSGGRDQAAFKEAQSDITNIIQEARALSLANILIEGRANDFETDYYHLAVATDGITLTAYGVDAHDVVIDTEVNSIEIDSEANLEISEALDIYYVPPYGEICFSYSGGCVFTSQPTEESFSLLRDGGASQEVTFTLSIYSGYPEVN